MANFKRVNRIPRNSGGKARQVGSTIGPYTPTGLLNYYQNPAAQIMEYIKAASLDPAIGGGIEFILRSLLGAIGEYEHPDKEIQDFVRTTLQEMDEPFSIVIYEMAFNTLTAGYNVSEINWKLVKDHPTCAGSQRIQNIINYHPASIFYSVNPKGLLTEGEAPLWGPYETGVWQYQWHGVPIPLPLNKVIVATHNRRYNNYYGESAIQKIYANFLQKAQAYPMWLTALDRYGTPLIHANVPKVNTPEQMQDPFTGEVRQATMMDQISVALQGITTGSTIVTEQPTGLPPVEIKAITTGNNFGRTFGDFINHHNREIYRGLLLPQLLLEGGNGSLGSGSAAPQHFEVFKLILEGLFLEVMGAFTQQCVGKLVWNNFNETNPGRFPFRHIDTATKKVMADVITNAIDYGILDMSNVKDLDHSRNTLGLPSLNQDELELQASKAVSGLKPGKFRESQIRAADKVLTRSLQMNAVDPVALEESVSWAQDRLGMPDSPGNSISTIYKDRMEAEQKELRTKKVSNEEIQKEAAAAKLLLDAQKQGLLSVPQLLAQIQWAINELGVASTSNPITQTPEVPKPIGDKNVRTSKPARTKKDTQGLPPEY